MTPGEDLLVRVDGGGDQGQEDHERGQANERGQTREGAGFAADDPPDLVGAGEDGQTHDVGGEARVRSRATGGKGQARAQAGQELRAVVRADARERPRHRGQGVGVAPAARGQARATPGRARAVVAARGHHAVAHFQVGRAAEGEGQVGVLAPSGEGGEGMVDAHRDALLRRVGEERLEVAAPRL